MNPNNQQPYYNYHQHTPGPSQPQWQAPLRQGWFDPRVGSPVANSPAAPPPPPPPPPSQAYDHGSSQQSGQWSHPPAPGYPNVPYQNTAAWGVKYNQSQQYDQQQDNELRPSLPPRPTSGQSGPSNQPTWSGQGSQQRPPTPPPRPAEYAVAPPPTQSHYYPHDQYSKRPTSHHYDPGSLSQSNTPASTWQNPPPRHDDPVSPLENRPTWQSTSAPQPHNEQYAPPHPSRPTTVHSPPPPAVGPSALGSGGPSDWEHFAGDDPYYTGVSPVLRPASQSQHRPQQQQEHQPPILYQQQHQPQAQPQPQQQQDHGRRQSQPYSATPEQAHVQPAHSSPAKPVYVSGSTPHQSNQSAGQHANQSPPNRFSVSLPYQDPRVPTGSDRPRYGSDGSLHAGPPPQRSGTIDSVINAWSASNNPTKMEPPKSSPRPSSATPERLRRLREVTTSQTQTDFPPTVKTEIKEVIKTETRDIDPYEDLKDEYRTSLNRYATMLRQEKAAASEQEKMKIVFEFVNREVNLRSVLFKTESAELVRTSELAELRRAAENRKQEATMQIPASIDSSSQPRPQARSVVDDKPQLTTNVSQPHHLRDDSFVVIGKDGEDDEYSPGGRPRIPTMNKVPTPQRLPTPSIQTGPPRGGTPVSQHHPRPPSPGANAPMTLDDYAMPENPRAGADRNVNTTPAQTQRLHDVTPTPPPKPVTNPGPIAFQPPRPAYTPFRYTESQPVPQPVVSGSNPAGMAYTKMRNEQAADSGRILKQEAPSLTVTAPDRDQNATPSRARQQHEEAFIGLLRQHSKAVKKPIRTGTPDAPAPLRAGTPGFARRPSLPPLVKSTESLRQSLPDSLTELNFTTKVHPKLVPINQSITNLTDDFSFIHATVVGWDRENRKVRQKLDAERAIRESESQAHIDDLFHGNEIGYADIADLEEDFKLEEATKKYDEDQDELDSFSVNVYEKITHRLASEVAQLETLRIRSLDMLDLESQSVSQRIQVATRNSASAVEKVPLAETMTMMLQIFNKIEVRQQKIAEANFEHERRRKRLELSVLYTNGDKEGVKQLEKEFDKAQSMQVLSEARKRDERANKLMDSFDRAVVRGLSENQEWIDEISNKAMLLRDLVLGSTSNGPQGQDREDLLYGPRGVREAMELLQEAVNLALADSQSLVQMSSQADKILNEADYAMFLAEAKIAEADDKEFGKLKSEKAKEDQKLGEESESRMSGVQKGPQEIFGFIKDVKGFIGEDQGHQDRINQALEAAKRRNQNPTTPTVQDPGVGSFREV